jgi:hypothetical protein
MLDWKSELARRLAPLPAGMTCMAPQAAGWCLPIAAALLIGFFVRALAKRSWRDALAIFALGAVCILLLVVGASPAFTLVTIVVGLNVSFSFATAGLLGWCAALAVTQLPPYTTAMVWSASHGPAWWGTACLPLGFLVAHASLCKSSRWQCLTAATLCIGAALVAYQIEMSPAWASVLAAAPATVYGAYALGSAQFHRWILVSGGLIAGAWLITLAPSLTGSGSIVVVLPREPSATSRYFENYQPVVDSLGFRGWKVTSDANDIRPGEVVLFPHAYHSEFSTQLDSIRALAHYSTLKLVVFGEHTDAEGIARSLERAEAPVGLNVDTTVPHRNGDAFGWMGGLGLLATPHAPLNRGASIALNSIWSIPLLWTPAAHSEIEVSVDGQLGDFIFRSGKRAGLFAEMAVGRRLGGPTWYVIGDGSPALGELMAAAPQDMARLIANATGWPVLLHGVAWLLIVVAALALRDYGPYLGLAGLAFALASAIAIVIPNRLVREDNGPVTVFGRSVYGDRAVGRAIVALAPEIMRSGVRVQIGGDQPELRAASQVWIARPSTSAAQKDCIRTGGIELAGIKLMNALACRQVPGTALLESGGDIVAYRRGRLVTIADDDFISNAAPESNIIWLRDRLAQFSSLH